FEELGGDIMIHGGWGSIGCLAIGDLAAEDLFVLAADAGFERAVVVLSPVDFRRRALPVDHRPASAWGDRLYAAIPRELDAPPRRAGRPARGASVDGGREGLGGAGARGGGGWGRFCRPLWGGGGGAGCVEGGRPPGPPPVARVPRRRRRCPGSPDRRGPRPG